MVARGLRGRSRARRRGRRGTGREAGFDHVHAEFGQRMREQELLRGVMLQPGDCSPSRRVVSKILMRCGPCVRALGFASGAS
jgi:hypothetical protein